MGNDVKLVLKKEIDMVKVVEDIEATKNMLEALIEYTDTINESIAYNTILNQHILSQLVDQKTFEKIDKKARRRAKSYTRKGMEQALKQDKEMFKKTLGEYLKNGKDNI